MASSIMRSPRCRFEPGCPSSAHRSMWRPVATSPCPLGPVIQRPGDGQRSGFGDRCCLGIVQLRVVRYCSDPRPRGVCLEAHARGSRTLPCAPRRRKPVRYEEHSSVPGEQPPLRRRNRPCLLGRRGYRRCRFAYRIRPPNGNGIGDPGGNRQRDNTFRHGSRAKPPVRASTHNADRLFAGGRRGPPGRKPRRGGSVRIKLTSGPVTRMSIGRSPPA